MYILSEGGLPLEDNVIALLVKAVNNSALVYNIPTDHDALPQHKAAEATKHGYLIYSDSGKL